MKTLSLSNFALYSLLASLCLPISLCGAAPTPTETSPAPPSPATTSPATTESSAAPSASPNRAENADQAARLRRLQRRRQQREQRRQRRRQQGQAQAHTRRPERALVASPALGPIPFPVGEHLVYKINAMNLNAGTATLSVGPRGNRNGQPVVQLSAQLTSGPLLEDIYRIRDRLTVLAHEESFLPIESTLALNEKRVRVTYQSNFNIETGRIRWSKTRHRRRKDHRREGRFQGIAPLYNSLTSLYALRRIPLQLGLSFDQYVWDGRRERLVTVKVASQDRVLTDLGWVEAFKLEVRTKITGGFMSPQQLNKRPLVARVWLSRDALRTPLKVVTPTRLGEAEAILTRRYVENQ